MTGLVIGKFSPLHLGHDVLIRHALEHSSALTIIVCGSLKHRYSLEQRLEWLREAYPEVMVLGLDQDSFDHTQEDAWVTAIQALLPVMPARYFTSETTAERYAKLLGMEYQIVDNLRQQVPISSTKINEHGTEYEQFLHPVVRL